jgi:hypothetical protein
VLTLASGGEIREQQQATMMADGDGAGDAGLGESVELSQSTNNGRDRSIPDSLVCVSLSLAACSIIAASFLAWAVARWGARLDGKSTRGRQGAGPSIARRLLLQPARSGRRPGFAAVAQASTHHQ